MEQAQDNGQIFEGPVGDTGQQEPGIDPNNPLRQPDWEEPQVDPLPPVIDNSNPMLGPAQPAPLQEEDPLANQYYSPQYYQNPEEPQQPLDPVVAGIESNQRAIYVLVFLMVFIILMVTEICCLFLRVCHTSEDIDIAPYASHGFLPLLAVALILGVMSYEAAEYIIHDCLKPLMYFSMIWALLVLGLSIAEFLAGMIMADDSDRDDTWNSLTPLGQEYYDDDQDKLAEAYRVNMSIVCISQMIVAVLLFLIGLCNMLLYRKTPTGFLPRAKRKVYLIPEQPPEDPINEEQVPLQQDQAPDGNQYPQDYNPMMPGYQEFQPPGYDQDQQVYDYTNPAPESQVPQYNIEMAQMGH